MEAGQDQSQPCLWREAVAVQPGSPEEGAELLLAQLVIAVLVGLPHHAGEVGLREVQAHLLTTTRQILQGDPSGALAVEKPKEGHHLLPVIPSEHLLGHHAHELIQVDLAAVVGVHVGDHAVDLLLGGVETQLLHCHPQLLGVYGPRAVGVEELEGLLYVGQLVLGQLFHLVVRAPPQGHPPAGAGGPGVRAPAASPRGGAAFGAERGGRSVGAGGAPLSLCAR
mmetsp:Transcript_57786/g.150233  ORF Transcript_57786/g.150233 Transcript_57786/m.150233 type:complete len:224 (-) Transcript_57786:16-687(-)